MKRKQAKAPDAHYCGVKCVWQEVNGMAIDLHGQFQNRASISRIELASGFSSAGRSEKMLIKTVEQAKRWFKIVGGFTLLLLGIAMVFSPGPGLLIMLVGLGILAAEFVWAKRLLNHLKEQGVKLRQTVFQHVDKAA
jgi:hypothetical protein